MIQQAHSHAASELTRISFLSKSIWNYPNHYFEIWKDELTITDRYINDHSVYIYWSNGQIVGYYSLVQADSSFLINGIKLHAGIWLDHMFVLPPHMKNGIGTKFCDHLKSLAKQHRWQTIHVLSEPNSVGFYSLQGFILNIQVPSSIPGRTTPWLSLQLH